MTALEALRDIRARLERLLEALVDGELELAYRLADDLAIDVDALLAGQTR